MAQQVADRRDMDFVLFEQMQADKLTEYPKYSDFNKKTFDLIISEARNLGIKEILPTYTEGDKEGVHFENGKVTAPKCFKRAYELQKEGEWTAMTEDPDLGGQGLPNIISTAANEFITGSNFALSGYSMMGHGTGKMIELYGTQDQKDLFLKNLYTGHWGGTMLLTESGAGSDVGALTTSAKKNDDGTYSITGNKIFITSGDHDLAENIIHPVLARIEGAPIGTKGISIFIVPKIWVNEDGSLGDANDVVCTGVEEKMGLHGSATCSMTLGGKGNCRGFLLGEENKGMRIMFTMMNEARLGVGLQAFTHASAAYLYALNYAKERLQGKDLESAMDPDAPQVPIIRHPDVRRMLLEMKAYVEGMRSFTYYISYCFDKEENAESEEEKARYNDMVELLTPVLKTYNANKGFDVCIKAIQVYGGAGYTQDYPVEQTARDCKIASIYEGTDGIQAMDLLVRKLGKKKGMVFLNFLGEIGKMAERAKGIDALKDLASLTEDAVKQLGDVTMLMGKAVMGPNFKVAFAHSVPLLDVVGDVVMAWMLLWRACIAGETLAKGAKKKDMSFYDGQIKTADYFIRNILPVTMGKMNSITAGGSAAIDITDEAFGG